MLIGNSLAGNVPSELSALSSLQDLVLFQNSLSGTIPGELFSLPMLNALDLEDNDFSGLAFPEEFFQAKDTLTIYQVSQNSLTGGIPADIGLVPKLRKLWIAENDISDSISRNDGAYGESFGVIFFSTRAFKLIFNFFWDPLLAIVCWIY